MVEKVVNSAKVNERTKVFELDGIKWHITKINALEGSNLLRKFTNSGAVDPQAFLSTMPDDQFKSIQNLLLENVKEVQIMGGQEVLLPLVLPSGVIGGKASENASLVFMLTVITLIFNLSGFFVGNTLTEFQKVVSSFNV